jgi:hypothetical protein
MATLDYTSTTWADGEDGATPINAERLNNIESGISNATAQINSNTTDIATIKDDLDSSGYVKLNDYVSYIKKAGIVSVVITALVPGTTGTVAVGTLPSGCRPAKIINFVTMDNSNNFRLNWINTSGVIWATASSTTASYSGNIAFVAG